MNNEERQDGNRGHGNKEGAERLISEEEMEAPAGVDIDENLLALEELSSLLENAPKNDRTALEKEIRGVKADYLRGDENAVRDYLHYHRIPSDNLMAEDPNMKLYHELRGDPKVDENLLTSTLKDYQAGDNQAIIHLADKVGHDSPVSAAAKSGKAPYRDSDLALKGFQAERESLEKRMTKGGMVMGDVEARRENLDAKIANLEREKASLGISRSAEENTREPSEENAKNLQTKVGEGKQVGLTEAETVEAKKTGEANGLKAQGADLNQPKERLALEIKAELEKSQSQGKTTDRLREIMRKIPLGRLHTEVEKNSTNSITLSRGVANALEKHQRKEMQRNNQGSRLKISFS